MEKFLKINKQVQVNKSQNQFFWKLYGPINKQNIRQNSALFDEIAFFSIFPQYDFDS